MFPVPRTRRLLGGKIHRARVTDADLDYEGSVTIDPVLLRAADIRPYEQVQVLDLTNGSRLETYAIEGEPGSGTLQINGAAAHLVDVGDLVIVLSYVEVDEQDVDAWRPRIVLVDDANRVRDRVDAVRG